MLSLFFRNLFFTIVQPGLVAGLVPYWILSIKVNSVFEQPPGFYQYAGALLFALGLVVLLLCIVRFAVQGKGTLSPLDPTRKLVATGFYRYSRNPMYVSVTLVLIGEAIFFQSISLAVYSLMVFLVFNLFIRYYEEPRLKKDFGEAYVRYCERVRRWI